MNAPSPISHLPSGRPAEAWRQAIERVLDGRTPFSMAFQPIVDIVRRSVVGYESLARFSGPPDAPPDRWFAMATMLGCGAELEAAAIAHGLAARDELPPNCFLTVNVDPNLLLSTEVASALHDSGSLHNVVVEFTEHVPVDDYAGLREAIARIRAAGGKIAIDDAGSGYAGLSHVLALRPELIKLDRELIRDIDRDPAKAALVEMLGDFAGRIDAWILAEGIEREDELRRLEGLGVPLAQGYFLGRPAPQWAAVSPDLVRAPKPPRRRSSDTTVAVCVDAAPTVAVGTVDHRWFEDDPDLDVVVEVDSWHRPVLIRLRGGAQVLEPQRTTSATPLVDALDRAIARRAEHRFTPIVCCDELGRFIGIVRIDRAASELLRRLRATPAS